MMLSSPSLYHVFVPSSSSASCSDLSFSSSISAFPFTLFHSTRRTPAPSNISFIAMAAAQSTRQQQYRPDNAAAAPSNRRQQYRPDNAADEPSNRRQQYRPDNASAAPYTRRQQYRPDNASAAPYTRRQQYRPDNAAAAPYTRRQQYRPDNASAAPYTRRQQYRPDNAAAAPYTRQQQYRPDNAAAAPYNRQQQYLPDNAADESVAPPVNSPQRLLRELNERKKAAFPKKKLPPRRFILKPPLDDTKLVERFLKSPQLALKSFPLLSSCLPPAQLNVADRTWIDEYLLEAKQALGYPLEPSVERFASDEGENPAQHFDTLLYVAFQHLQESCQRTKARHVRHGHSRLWFLGQYVLELALCEFFLQRYPRESPAPIRERVYALIGKRFLPKWIKAASLQNLIFPYDEMDKMIRKDREPPSKSVFWALFGAIYLCFGMPEVYRVLFEAFGMDPEDESCQPKLRRQLEDVDYVSVEFEGRQLSWQDVAAYKPPEDALFAHPRLFRACVPPGMHRFRGNIWDFDSRPKVMQALGYPLKMNDRIPEITDARNIELGLGLQLCFLHPSKYKFEHPRFCWERLEYLGQKIQDLVMAERLLMKHLDAPGRWLQEKHRRTLMNKFCGRYLRDKHLHHHIMLSEQVQDKFEHNRRLRNPATTAVNQALHGLAYAVYGKPDVRRLMFEVFDFEQIQPKAVLNVRR